MQFYNRTAELTLLDTIKKDSLQQSRMTIVTGRRRIGKTRLIKESLQDTPYLYFFIARKNERLLCEEFTELIKEAGIPVYGQITQFKDLFLLLVNHAVQHPITLVIDEFQEFYRINSSVYSDLQNIWDQYKDKSRMNLILSGSVYSLMRKIFQDSKEPLFGRANEQLFIRPFSVKVQQQIVADYFPTYSNKDLLSFYILTGGIPKYIEQFVDKNCLSHEAMLGEMLRSNSLFLEEGKNVLIEEFGKEYTLYFSILSLISTGKTTRAQIESVLQKDIGGYLNRLEEDYQVIQKLRPIFAKPGSRTVKYFLKDNFLNFWFRFIYKNKGAVEIENFEYLHKIINRDFPTFSGLFLERFFKEYLAATKQYSLIGNYWEKGNKNEIDIVAINELEKKALIAEVKLQEKNISIPQLQVKAQQLIKKLGGYEIIYKGFSMQNLADLFDKQI